MTTYYRTVITEVGPDVADLLDGGMLILFADGSPRELAEVSVLHKVAEGPTAEPPPVGAEIAIGSVRAKLTAIGDYAWNKIADIGHVVINFDGAATSGRPGEINATPVTTSELGGVLEPGTTIAITG